LGVDTPKHELVGIFERAAGQQGVDIAKKLTGLFMRASDNRKEAHLQPPAIARQIGRYRADLGKVEIESTAIIFDATVCERVADHCLHIA